MEQTWEKIVEALRNEPGQCATGVARVVGINASTASYHLRRLAREGKVSFADFGRERVWFALGCQLCPVLRRAVPAMRRAGVAPIAVAMTEAPAALAHLAADAGLSHGEAEWAFKVMQDAGIATRSQTGKARLVAGGEECVARALAQEPCPLWGSCAPSKNLVTDLRPTSSRS